MRWKGPERIGDDVKRQLGRFGPGGAMAEIVRAWPEAVGDNIARNAWPARIARDGTLHVNTSSSAWAFELGQLSAEIAAKLEGMLGKKAPKSFRLSVVLLHEPVAGEVGEPRSEVPEPTEEALQTAVALAAGIEDEELRKRVQRAAA